MVKKQRDKGKRLNNVGEGEAKGRMRKRGEGYF